MTYGIITGAHFFPHAWFYKAPPFAVMAEVISVGCLVIGGRTATTTPYWVPVFLVGGLLVLEALLFANYRRHQPALLVAASAH